MKLILTVVLAVASFERCRGAISARCMRSVEQAAECALGEAKQCFNNNGCVFDPEKMHAHDHERAETSCQNNPMRFLMRSAMADARPCMEAEFSNLSHEAKMFIHKMRRMMRHRGREGRDEEHPHPRGHEHMAERMRGKMQNKVEAMCGATAAPAIMQCLQGLREGMEGRIQSCSQQYLSDACKEEVKRGACRCLQEVVRTSTSVEEGLACMRSSPNAPPLFRGMTKQRLSFMLTAGCSMPAGVLEQGLRSQIRNFRNRRFGRQ